MPERSARADARGHHERYCCRCDVTLPWWMLPWSMLPSAPETGNSVTKVIHNFGRAEHVDRDALARPVSSISRFLTPAQAVSAAESVEVEILDSRPVGGAWVLDRVWERLGIGAAIRQVAAGGRLDAEVTERVLFAFVAQRALKPGSKLAATDWVAKSVAIDGCPGFTDDAAYRGMDFLLDPLGEIAGEVFRLGRRLVKYSVYTSRFSFVGQSEFMLGQPGWSWLFLGASAEPCGQRVQPRRRFVTGSPVSPRESARVQRPAAAWSGPVSQLVSRSSRSAVWSRVRSSTCTHGAGIGWCCWCHPSPPVSGSRPRPACPRCRGWPATAT